MSISQIIERIVHPHHHAKLTPEQKAQRIRDEREMLRKSGFWIGTG